MKKIIVPVTAVLITLALCGTIYAKYRKGFVVVTTTENSVVIKGKDDVEISVKTSPKKYKIGDKVKYDETRNRLRPDVRMELHGC